MAGAKLGFVADKATIKPQLGQMSAMQAAIIADFVATPMVQEGAYRQVVSHLASRNPAVTLQIEMFASPCGAHAKPNNH